MNAERDIRHLADQEVLALEPRVVARDDGTILQRCGDRISEGEPSSDDLEAVLSQRGRSVKSRESRDPESNAPWTREEHVTRVRPCMPTRYLFPHAPSITTIAATAGRDSFPKPASRLCRAPGDPAAQPQDREGGKAWRASARRRAERTAQGTNPDPPGVNAALGGAHRRGKKKRRADSSIDPPMTEGFTPQSALLLTSTPPKSLTYFLPFFVAFFFAAFFFAAIVSSPPLL